MIFTELFAKSTYKSRAGNRFYGTEYDIWGDFVLVGNNEKKSFGPFMSNFSCFHGQK